MISLCRGITRRDCLLEGSRGRVRHLTVRIFLLTLLSLTCAVPLAAQRGALARSRNLDELVGQAAVIVRGHVVRAYVEPHPDLRHLWTVVVTLRVQETLKGDAGVTFTFRQFIWDMRDRYEAAGYRKGQELLLLMNAPTPYGLSSPAGLEQGRFRIVPDSEGKRHAVNGHGNAGLFRNLETLLKRKGVPVPPALSTFVQQQQFGAVPLEEFEGLIRNLAGVN